MYARNMIEVMFVLWWEFPNSPIPFLTISINFVQIFNWIPLYNNYYSSIATDLAW